MLRFYRKNYTATGKTQSEAEEAFGKENIALWASSYDVAPHPMSTDGLYYPKDDRRCGLARDFVSAWPQVFQLLSAGVAKPKPTGSLSCANACFVPSDTVLDFPVSVFVQDRCVDGFEQET